MSIYRSIITGIMITIMAVGYVHQRVEIVKTGYNLQKDRENLSRLVDRNSKLMYNLFKLESPRNLLASMDDEKIEFSGYNMAKEDSRLHRIAGAYYDSGIKTGSVIGRFLDFFVEDAEASPRK
jgi:hypothetical protein